MPSVHEASNYRYSSYELKAIKANQNTRAVGSPATVKEKLLEIAQRFNADELVILSITHDVEARRRSYELLSEAWHDI